MCEQLETLIRDIGYDIEKTLQRTKEEQRLSKLIESECCKMEMECKKISEQIDKMEEDNAVLEKQIARETENIKSLQYSFDLSVHKEEALDKQLKDLKLQFQSTKEEHDQHLASTQEKIADYEQRVQTDPLLKLFNDGVAAVPFAERSDALFEDVVKKTVASYVAGDSQPSPVGVGEADMETAEQSAISSTQDNGQEGAVGALPRTPCSSPVVAGAGKEDSRTARGEGLLAYDTLLESPRVSAESSVYHTELLDTPSVYAMRNSQMDDCEG